MELNIVSEMRDRSNYFKNIATISSKYCLKDFSSSDLSDDDITCLKKESLKLHFIVNSSQLERWALNKSKRPLEEYYWLGIR